MTIPLVNFWSFLNGPVWFHTLIDEVIFHSFGSFFGNLCLLFFCMHFCELLYFSLVEVYFLKIHFVLVETINFLYLFCSLCNLICEAYIVYISCKFIESKPSFSHSDCKSFGFRVFVQEYNFVADNNKIADRSVTTLWNLHYAKFICHLEYIIKFTILSLQ